MKAKQAVLYGSMALNVALLVLFAWPRHEANLAFGQYGVTAGSFAAASARESGSQEATWIADRVSGVLAVYDYDTNAKGAVLVDRKNLKADFEVNQLGNLMVVPAYVSDTRGVVYVIDTDAQRMVVYEYSRSNGGLSIGQKIDLTAVLHPVQPAAAPATDEGAVGE